MKGQTMESRLHFSDYLKLQMEHLKQLREFADGDQDVINSFTQSYYGLANADTREIAIQKQLEETYGLSLPDYLEFLRLSIITVSFLDPLRRCMACICEHRNTIIGLLESMDEVRSVTAEFQEELGNTEYDKSFLQDAYADFLEKKLKLYDEGDFKTIEAIVSDATAIFQDIIDGNLCQALPKLRKSVKKDGNDSLQYYYDEIEPILQKSELPIMQSLFEKEFVSELIDEFKAQQPREKEGADFTLPDNLFELELELDPNKYMGIIKDKYKNPSAIASLINYFVIKGNIENKIEVKENLVYRLTGRMKPSVLLERIEWHGKSAYLFYLCSCFYNGGYNKLKIFFDAIEDNSFLSKTSSSGARPPKGFEDLMNDLFGKK